MIRFNVKFILLFKTCSKFKHVVLEDNKKKKERIPYGNIFQKLIQFFVVVIAFWWCFDIFLALEYIDVAMYRSADNSDFTPFFIILIN